MSRVEDHDKQARLDNLGLRSDALHSLYESAMSDLMRARLQHACAQARAESRGRQAKRLNSEVHDLEAELTEARTRIAELEADTPHGDGAIYHGTLLWLLGPTALDHGIPADAAKGDALCNRVRAVMEAHLVGVAALEAAERDARARIAALEAEVAALRESDTVDVPPVDPPDEDADQYPRVEWGGGECPLPWHVAIEVWLRSGFTTDGIATAKAGEYRWTHPETGVWDDIFAYRIAPDSEQTREGLAALREYLRTHEPDGTPKADTGTDTEPPTGVWIPHTPGPCPYPERVGRVRTADGVEPEHVWPLGDWPKEWWHHPKAIPWEDHITHFMLKP